MKLSELRQDMVSGDWIVITSKKTGKPNDFKLNYRRPKVSKRNCPFEDLEIFSERDPISQFNNKKDWFLKIVENRYPVFQHRENCSRTGSWGPYKVTTGVGHHDLVITRSHEKDFPDLKLSEAEDVFRSFKARYLQILKDKCLAYVSIFHNYGPRAGASIYHPHYQIISIPVVPPDVSHSLKGSLRFYRETKKCVHCVMIDWEKKERRRLIFENQSAIAFAPFVSRNGFEVRIFPKNHLPFFEETEAADLAAVADALRAVLKKVKKALKDPDYNFFIHTAPIKDKGRYRNYHWHIEVLPKFNVYAGFELGTGIEINPVDPDEAARILRKAK